MIAADSGQVHQRIAFWREAATHAGTIADGVTKGSFATPLQVPSAHGKQVELHITSDQAVAVFLRFKSASNIVVVDGPVTNLTANTPVRILDVAGNGQNVEVVVTNASGATATISAWLCAK